MPQILLQETERETKEVLPALQEKKYLRLVGDKVIYITGAEVAEEEVLAGPCKRLSEQDILVSEWNCRVEWANQLKERLSFLHQMMRDDEQRPSQYEPDYNVLWDQYRDAIESLREIDFEAVDQFRDKVVARVKELEVRLNAMCDNWDPDDFDDFERMLALYEKLHDQALALGGKNEILK